MQFQACAYCDHPNPAGTDFCNDCGAALHLKPCRACGAEATASTRHCPACAALFPSRPMIEVDIPWAVRHTALLSGPSCSGAATPSARALPTIGAGSDVKRVTAATQASAKTREVIGRASMGASPGEISLPRHAAKRRWCKHWRTFAAVQQSAEATDDRLRAHQGNNSGR